MTFDGFLEFLDSRDKELDVEFLQIDVRKMIGISGDELYRDFPFKFTVDNRPNVDGVTHYSMKSAGFSCHAFDVIFLD